MIQIIEKGKYAIEENVFMEVFHISWHHHHHETTVKIYKSVKYAIKLVYFDIQINFFSFDRRQDAFYDYEKPNIKEDRLWLKAILNLNTDY